MKKNGKIQFAVCLNNEGYPASLEVGKLYRVIADEEAAKENLLRVVDESGEDYAFAANRFYLVELPQMVKKNLLTAYQTSLGNLAL
jgi:prephenate dehydratase